MGYDLDAAILKVLQPAAGRRVLATYVVRNCLRSVITPWPDTSKVLRRLKALERAGKVRRVPTTYVTMLSWEAAQ